MTTITVGCASLHHDVVHDECLSANSGTIDSGTRGARSFPDADVLYRGSRRLTNDDLIAATSDVPAASDLAYAAQRDQRAGVGVLIAGGFMFAPGIGLTGFGLDQGERTTTTVGTVLTVAGAATLFTGAMVLLRADRERGRALATYNAAMRTSCAR